MPPTIWSLLLQTFDMELVDLAIRCIGNEFECDTTAAPDTHVFVTQTIWSVLLRNFDMELVDPFPEADYQSMVVGPKSCRIRYRRRKL